MRRLVLVLLWCAIVSCRGDSIFGVSADGEPASVAWSSVEVAGGQVYRADLSVDSANGTYHVVRCQGGVTGECTNTEFRSGVVPPAVLAQLFELAQTRDFRRLKAEYQLRDDVIPPDGGWTELTVVANERRKIVAWDKHVSIPQILRDYGCLMLAATESLLCD
jgi:hypothetical protein